jgi:hypothetical protein
MRYFCQADVENNPYPSSLYRYREEDELIYEEFWCTKSLAWIPTTELTRLLTGGDCSTMEITEEFARELQNE